MTYTRSNRRRPVAKTPRSSFRKPSKKPSRRSLWLKILLGFLGFGFLIFCAIGIYVYSLWVDLPDVKKLADYQYDLPTRVFDRNGALAAEYYEQRRILVHSEDIPDIVRKAVLAIEDNRFYSHLGIDPIRITKAFLVNLSTFSFREGASTLTQQTAKQFLLTPEKNLERKVKEILLSLQMEQIFTKDKILELYLNKAFFGRQSYGIEAAARNYFSKSLKELNIAEAALLAGLLKAPSRYSPTRNIVRAKRRRDLVLTMMYRNEFITKEELICMKNSPVKLNLDKKRSVPGLSYFIEEVRRILTDSLGREKLITGGYKITTTMDLQIQERAQEALEKGLERVDERHGYRGPLKNILKDGEIDLEQLESLTENNFVEDSKYLTGVVKDVSNDALKVDLGTSFGKLSLENANWAIPYDLNTLVHENNQLSSLKESFQRGDVIFVRPMNDASMDAWIDKDKEEYVCAPEEQNQTEEELVDLKQFEEESDSKEIEKEDKPVFDVKLYQIPENNGALLSMNPQTGEVYSIAGGYSFGKSQFNRATQSYRQSGSVFKPFVYTVALKNGYKPNDILEDTPLTFNDLVTSYSWIPKNYGGKFEGSITFRDALVKSKNIPTIKIAKDIGIRSVVRFMGSMGVDTSKLPKDLSASLGSGSLTLVDLISAYSLFENGGFVPKPIYIQKIEDRSGKILFESKQEKKKVLDSQTAYIMHTILRDIVRRGTGKVAKKIERESYGKTGTTDNNTDAWYIGYVPNFIAGVYVGNDSPAIPLGFAETGGRAAAPIWVDFMKSILSLDKKEIFSGDIPRPPGVISMKVSKSTGKLACGNEKDQYTEYFIAGNEPTICSSREEINGFGQAPSENLNSPQDLPGEIEL